MTSGMTPQAGTIGAMEFKNVPALAGSLVLDHVKGHRCGYVPNERTEDDDVKTIDARCISAYRVPVIEPTVKINIELFDALNDGRNDLHAVRKIRKILETAGLRVEVHPLERTEAQRLELLADRLLAEAAELVGGADG